MGAYLFKVHLEFFFTEKLDTYNHFYCTINKKTRHSHFPQNCFDYKKASSDSDQQYVPIERSKTISGVSVPNPTI